MCQMLLVPNKCMLAEHYVSGYAFMKIQRLALIHMKNLFSSASYPSVVA